MAIFDLLLHHPHHPTPTPTPASTTSPLVDPVSDFLPNSATTQLFVLGGIALVVLLMFGIKFWRTALLFVATAGLVAVAGPWAPAALAVSVLSLVLVLRKVFPGAWRSRVRPRLQSWRIRWFLYGPRWKNLAERHGLFVRDFQQPSIWAGQTNPAATPRSVVVRAKLKKVVWTPTTDRLLVQLPAGMSASDVTKIVEPLAFATDSLGCRVRPEPKGCLVWIELLRRDPLTEPIPALSIRANVDLRAVPVGRCEDGSTWTLPVVGTHVLVAGSTGAGKGSVMWSLMRGLAPAIADGTVEVWGFDPKGGMELAMGAGLFARLFTGDAEEMAEGLEQCAELMHARTKQLAGITRLHKPTPAEPLRIVLIDELAALTALAEKRTVQRVDNALRRILTQGRAPGCVVIGFLQDPGKDVLAYRNLFPTRVALRLAEAVEVDMVLGEGVRARGAEAHRIDIYTPGVGWIRHESSPDPIRVRAAYVTDHQIRLMAELHPAGSNRAQVIRGEVEPVKAAEHTQSGPYSSDGSWPAAGSGDAA